MSEYQQDGNPSKWGAGVYYGVTAVVVLILAVSVIVGRVFYGRKMKRAAQRRIDVERATQTSHAGPNDDLQTRRGEAPGLPTYNEPGTTVPMPTLPYPEAAYRPDEAHPDSQQDPSLPGYEHNGPPKYDYGANQPPAVQQPSVPFYTTAEQQQQQQVQQQQQEMQQMGDQRVFTPATTPNIANQVPLYPVSEEPIGTLHTVSLDNPWQDRNRA
ncbi:MAG: hypothetical protein CYPHOPRED_000835 [Cyphobasidiales sp. Tagirdzhanova-0007]|nr:MAG: hypothetical protein CYPHOPRED_000835 [Cyphobasidiales sp. Tagirdzhanova-0007]